MQDTAVKIVGITKAFGANNVLRGIDLDLPAGKVTVLMGANGAGKSTLVKILSGVYPANGGTVMLYGDRFDPASPAAAINAGIVTVHQSISDGVIPDLDIASNLMLDQLARPGSGFFLNRREMHRQAREIAAAMALDVDVRQLVSELGLADRQLVAIARAMARKPKLLILDEPTSSLSATEATRLFKLLDHLRSLGVAILYISHRMSDIHAIADRIVSMRDGRISGIFTDSPLDYEGAVKAMLGHSMSEVNIDIPQVGAPVMRLSDICLLPDSKPFSLDLMANEVIAITGLVGSGKTEFADILFGLSKPFSGAMNLLGTPYHPASQRQAIEKGVFLCPKDRASNAVVADFDITKNITVPFLARHSVFSFINASSEHKTARRMISDLGIICQSEADEINSLSGGNQQKVMIGRWLAEASNLLVLDEPFQGVDIKARRDIGNKIRQSAKGRATIVLVAEMDEAVEIADRIVVMNDHTIVGNHPNSNINLEQVLAEVVGQQSEPTGNDKHEL
ncbi:Ribose ABC transport system, ATP-binding protein RbsA (TC 3.A.1.2.1) [hydrothermal vent metagenome]|uniref:Ribose ABC transport system, ATP-binding protein RbsA (TC 3.A.1.2.1) n=1 Tax=hydrothermal vent metagenome TaxID=652676 RepID=A0A3B0UCV1_9ZZZZ